MAINHVTAISRLLKCCLQTGHSVGELGCAYGDGCLTAEEMILSAYSRGLVSLETPFIRGSMAAIGLGYEQVYVPVVLILHKCDFARYSNFVLLKYLHISLP